VEKWKLGDYEFIYNPSSDEENIELENFNNYSLTGKHYGQYRHSKKTRNFKTALYNKSGNSIIEQVNVSANCSYIARSENRIYLAYENYVQVRDMGYNLINFFTCPWEINGIVINDDIYILGNYRINRCNISGSILDYIDLIEDMFTCKSLTCSGNTLYTLHPDGYIYQIDYSGNAFEVFYTIDDYDNMSDNFLNLYYDDSYFWYYNNYRKSFFQIEIGDTQKVVNILPISTLNLNESSGLIYGEDSYLLSKNNLYKISLNKINESLFELEKQLKSGKLILKNEIGVTISGCVMDLNIEEVNRDIDKPFYKINLLFMEL